MSDRKKKLIEEVGPIWNVLDGGLWHTTHPKRFLQILQTGALLPEPNIPDSERWGTAQGPKHYPYVRFIGGVSLFDFDGFDSIEYTKRCPSCSWREFLPFRRSWNGAVWIEVDRSLVADRFISGNDLLKRQKDKNELAHNIMPFIECAYIGELTLTVCKRVFFIRVGGKGHFEELSILDFDHRVYEKFLEKWRLDCEKNWDDTLIKALQKGRVKDIES